MNSMDVMSNNTERKMIQKVKGIVIWLCYYSVADINKYSDVIVISLRNISLIKCFIKFYLLLFRLFVFRLQN